MSYDDQDQILSFDGPDCLVDFSNLLSEGDRGITGSGCVCAIKIFVHFDCLFFEVGDQFHVLHEGIAKYNKLLFINLNI